MVCFYFGEDYGLTYKRSSDFFNGEEYKKIDLLKDGLGFLFDEISSFSLFDEKKNVLVFNCDFFSKKSILTDEKKEVFLSLISDYPEENSLIFVIDGKISKSSFYNELKKTGVLFKEVNSFTEEEYYLLFCKIAKDRNKDIDRELFDIFYKSVGNDYLKFINEAEKLFSYPDKIDKDVIFSLVSVTIEDNVFDLCNLIVKKRKKEALKRFRELRYLGYDALSLLLIILSQLRFIYLVKYLAEKRFSKDEIASELSSESKKISSGRIYYILKDCLLSSFEISSLLLKLGKIEEDIKVSADNPDFLLEMFILNSDK